MAEKEVPLRKEIGSLPSTVCYKTGFVFQQCKSLRVSGDPNNPQFACGHSIAKEISKAEPDCEYHDYISPPEA